jgi:16S rRNA (guanine966-N2)-methyltransferase
MIKIISGDFKGRKLNNLKIDILRPTQAKVRKSIMDSIRDFDKKSVLDLFAGIGTLGLESISRGAEKVKFVEKNNRVIKVLEKNSDMFNLSSKSTIIKSDVLKFLNDEYEKYDIVFADPPYGEYSFDILYPLISNIMNNRGIFCYESEKKEIEKKEDIKIKHYGNTQVILWKKK